MTDYFNFLGLPLLVQELITNEIVHNSIPEDRIQLALTSKYCNELVQRARPKKIIDQFSICSSFFYCVDGKEYYKSTEELMDILPNCQIKELQLDGESVLSEDYSEFLHILLEAARFATKLDIILPSYSDVEAEDVGFCVKLKHLKSVTMEGLKLILPYYPSRVKLKLDFFRRPKDFLEDLATKSQNCPLSFFELQYAVPRANLLKKCQQFLQTANFSTGAVVCIRDDFACYTVYLTYVGQNTFTFDDIFSNDYMPIFISQNFNGKNRILKLKTSLYHPEKAFNVISALNPVKNYFSGVFKKDQRQMFINLENVDRDEILKIKFVNEMKFFILPDDVDSFFHPIYSASMLESAFPTANFTTPEERVEKINNVLGTNIQLIRAENFAQTVVVEQPFVPN